MADEHELVRRCLLRDPAAWRTLYDRHFGKVARLVHALGIVDGEADDLCQEIFIIVYRHLGRFRGEARLATWIHRLSTREAIRYAKRRRLKRALLDLWKRELTPTCRATGRRTRRPAASTWPSSSAGCRRSAGWRS